MSRGIDLVIFDLDGTLVSSEALAEKVEAQVIHGQLGLDVSEAEIASLFRGRTIDFMMTEMASRYGAPLPDSFLPALSQAYDRAVATELRASVGVEDAIKAIVPIPLCVASNGEPETIANCVEVVGLASYFDGKYFSARNVEHPKPAPDVFLLAAETMGARPSHTVVVEDTVLGITAALAAGMRAIGYAGNHLYSKPALEETGVPVITDYADLPGLILQ